MTNPIADSVERDAASDAPASSPWVLLAVSWLFVGVPLAWGIVATLTKAARLFR